MGLLDEAYNRYNVCLADINAIIENQEIEGGSILEQSDFFIKYLLDNPHVKLVLEIGFNTGSSANAFLAARDDIKVISVDIGVHAYISRCKNAIDKYYPDRHALLIGDSKEVIPRLSIIPDLIFIDGDHVEPAPLIDARNCLAISAPHTILIMDDTTLTMGWAGVLQAMCELIRTREIDTTYVDSHTIKNRGWTLFRKALNLDGKQIQPPLVVPAQLQE
jgi:predicted O-methyltransferase YrrM